MKHVVVGLSGGVDSSVAAALLKQDGYEVTGVYMKNWTQDVAGVACPWQEELRDARAVAARLDIPFRVYDFEAEYRGRVVEYLVREYQAGRTPNPDIMCNQEVKFKLFLEAALRDGAELVATGHYAQVRDGRLWRSADSVKDQTYFLYRVRREALERTLFPIGAYTKPQVRRLAARFGLPTAAKKDSQGLCFVGPVGMKAFLRHYIAPAPGPIVLAGRVIGQHDGAVFYTIGQRQGLGVGGGRPLYVTGKDMATNTVYVTDDANDPQLSSKRLQLTDVCWIDAVPEAGRHYQVRVRHRGELIDCRFEHDGYVQLARPAKALAAGQSAVLYDGDKVLGGGVIKAVAPATISL